MFIPYPQNLEVIEYRTKRLHRQALPFVILLWAHDTQFSVAIVLLINFRRNNNVL